MLRELANHNDDIRRLLEKGYALGFDSNYLIVRDVPYLNERGELKIGAIVCKMKTADNIHFEQQDHQVLFAGSHPCALDGSPIPNFGGGPAQLALSEASKDVVVERSFSNKPKKTGQFQDHFEKIESYVAQISGPAIELHGVRPYTFRSVETEEPNPIFKVRDTLTSLAEITDLAQKFANDDVAVIGLGGTGSYLLDFLVKTQVPRIRAFDPDLFYVHNAFRSPGAIGTDEFGKPKAEIYQARHDNFRYGLTITQKFIDESSGDDLAGVTFAFVCVDKGSSRKGIFDLSSGKADSVHRCGDGAEETEWTSDRHGARNLLFKNGRQQDSSDGPCRRSRRSQRYLSNQYPDRRVECPQCLPGGRQIQTTARLLS